MSEAINHACAVPQCYVKIQILAIDQYDKCLKIIKDKLSNNNMWLKLLNKNFINYNKSKKMLASRKRAHNETHHNVFYFFICQILCP